ncbi:MAG TPA: TolC family protein [Chitinophagaceae bacterium]|nr:TolC family protein [Chitinophagaceae bacterium]
MRRIIPLLFLSIAPFVSRAQETVQLSLQDCIDYALKNSAAAKNARLDVALQKAQNAEVTGQTLPQISAEGKYTRFIDVQQQFLPSTFLNPNAPFEWVPFAFSPKQMSQGAINASQLLFNGSLFVALQARNTLMLLAEQNADMKAEDIRYNVQKAYTGLLIANRQRELTNRTISVLRSFTNDIALTYQNGLAEKIDVDRSLVQLSNLQSDSIGLNSMIEVNEKMLKFTMGMDLNTPIVLTDDNMIDNVDAASAILLRDESYESRLSYQLANTALRLQQYDLKRYRFEGMPTLSAFGSAGYNRAGDKITDLTNKPYPGFSLVGLQLNVPIFDGLQRRNRVKAAKLKVEKAENDLANAKLSIDVQTKSAKVTLNNAIQTVESRKRTMDLAKSVLDLAQRKYDAGVGTNQEFVLAQQDYLGAQANYFNALLTVFNAQADLQKSLGLLK